VPLLIESFAPPPFLFVRPFFSSSLDSPSKRRIDRKNKQTNKQTNRSIRWDRPRTPHPAYLAFATVYAIALVTGHFQDASGTTDIVAPFAAREVWWALRDGYVGDLLSHAFRNGGLIVGDHFEYIASSAAVGHRYADISPLELYRSVRDGYAGNTLLSPSAGVFGSGNGDGGMLVDGSDVVPLAPREMWWAIKGGYAYDMIAHWFRNGGLLV
jgi:hypothetical protein